MNKDQLPKSLKDLSTHYTADVRTIHATVSGIDYPASEPTTRRDEVMLIPQGLSEFGLVVLTEEPKSETRLINGKKQEISLYKGGDFAVYALSDKISFTQILKTSKQLYDYGDQRKKLYPDDNKTRFELSINDYLEYLGYTKRKDGSFDPKDRRKVWNEIMEVLDTRVIMAITYYGRNLKQKRKATQTVVMEDTLIKYAKYNVYENVTQEEAISLSMDNPPQSIIIEIPTALARQLGGYQEGAIRYNPNLIAEPKTEAKDNRGFLQEDSDNYRLWQYVFYELNKAIQPTRYYNVSEMKQIMKSREKDKTWKLAKFLDTLEERKNIKTWGFAPLNRTKLNKTENRQPLVWVDHSDTATFEVARPFYPEKKKDNVEKEVKDLIKRVGKIEEEL